jgi:hypothetical protein
VLEPVTIAKEPNRLQFAAKASGIELLSTQKLQVVVGFDVGLALGNLVG